MFLVIRVASHTYDAVGMYDSPLLGFANEAPGGGFCIA